LQNETSVKNLLSMRRFFSHESEEIIHTVAEIKELSLHQFT